VKRKIIFLTVIILAVSVCLAAGDKDKVKYEKYYRDPTLKRIIEKMDSLRALADSLTGEIDSRFSAEKKKKKDDRRVIRFDFSNIEKPESPESFRPPFHFDPVPQHLSGMCWCFSTTSFMESEIKRITGREIKLSELHTIYWEYVEKARGYVQKRGNQPFAQGGESDGMFIIWDKYGAVPADVYTGFPHGGDKHNHSPLIKELKAYLYMCRDKGSWDEESIIEHVKIILNRHIGEPPESFEFEGSEITPVEFVKEVLQVDSSDYVQFMSTLSVPFYTFDKFDVPDNWRPTSSYFNVPLDEYYEYIAKAAEQGYTVCIGGDVSEPGYYGFEDAAVVPTFDIPPEYIDQDSREFRFYNRTTEDDHGVHLLASQKIGETDWFLIKDSARASRHGNFHGYLFYTGDYIRLKMLTYTVHKDVVRDLAGKMKKARKE
jgi:bleomycin hydrolase